MVTIKNFIKNYGDFHLDITMDLPAGTITGLVGKNGAGKTTIIKAILGLIKPDSGRITVFGKEAYYLSSVEKQKIGVALSDSGFSNYLTISDIVKILSSLYPSFHKQQFLKQCEQQDLPVKKMIKEFSTGMKAKLRVLVALSHNADLIIMDEPTAGLDVEARNGILDILRNYLTENEKCSILITSHIATDLEGLCDDIYLIHKGKMILHEETDVILSQYAILKADEKTFKAIDQTHLLAVKKESFGYTAITDQKQYYMENYKDLVIEKSGIDDIILLMTGGN